MLHWALMALLIAKIVSLSGSAASSYCHCDLTQSFCDVACCCDSDCSTSPSSDCYNSKANSYCPDPTFFSRLGSTYLNSQGCFYYNSTNTIIEEVTLATRQTNQIISQKQSITRVSASNAPVLAGYQQGDFLSVSGNPNFYLLKTNGDCLTTSDTATPIFNLRFGLTMKIQCSCTSCGNSIPQLFSSFSGKSISQFSVDATKNITLPSINDAGITDVQINFIIGTYGSSGIKYIERVTSSTSSSGGTTRSLTFYFVQTSTILEQSSSPSFFPQIPKDMFYPIYLLS